MAGTLLALSVFFRLVASSPLQPSPAEGNVPSIANATEFINTQELSTPFPYEFPLLGNASENAATRFPMAQCNGFTLEEATIDQLQDLMGSGRLASVQVVLCYLQRIYQTDPYIKYSLPKNEPL